MTPHPLSARAYGLGRRLVPLLALLLLLVSPALAGAGSVEWHEVPATAEGRQWWDSGSLRFDRQGRLSVLSRFQPPSPAGEDGETSATRPPIGTLYVMQLDCDQALYRDTSVNGLPQWQAEWRPVAGDGLMTSVLQEACAAATASR
ncbi:MAG: hypothetical protein ACK55E_02960 [Cyanobacteriota bacterium]|jgi:hypothetical protein